VGQVERQIEIGRPVEEVFGFVADARNDPQWCSTVKSCRQLSGDGPGDGARYEARHRPTPVHPVMRRELQVVEYEPPRLVRWRQEDENGVFDITYRVHPSAAGARFTQADEIAWKVPRPIGAMAERLFVRRHIGQQMKALKQLLESRA
jgi:uncharacterized protein YndB with AHSA1/START domain